MDNLALQPVICWPYYVRHDKIAIGTHGIGTCFLFSLLLKDETSGCKMLQRARKLEQISWQVLFKSHANHSDGPMFLDRLIEAID